MSDLTRQQLCATLNVSESTVRRWELDGLPCTPIGLRHKRYDLAECKKWLKEQSCQHGSTKKADATSRSWSTANAHGQGGAWTHQHHHDAAVCAPSIREKASRSIEDRRFGFCRNCTGNCTGKKKRSVIYSYGAFIYLVGDTWIEHVTPAV